MLIENAEFDNAVSTLFKIMANTPSAKKRARQAEKRRNHNASQRSNLRTATKKVIALAESGDKQKALAAYQAAVPIIDAAASKGIIHRNKAARDKGRLNNRVKAL